MEAVKCFFALTTFSFFYGAWCNEDIQLLNDRLDAFSKRFNYLENVIFSDESILSTKQEERILSLKTEMKTYFRQHVQTALSEILLGESFEEIIKSEIVSEMRHVKRTNHQMRRRLHEVMTALRKVQEDNMAYREALVKGEREISELMSCSKYLVKSELELAERGRLISDLQRKLMEQNGSYTLANNTNNEQSDPVTECSKCFHSEVVTNKLIELDHKINEVNETLMAGLCKESNVTINTEDTMMETTTQTSLSTTSTPNTESTTVTTIPTTDPQEERGRILVVPIWSSSSHQFRQVKFHSNSLDIYSYLRLKNVDSVLYISKINSLLIGLYNPHKIISSKLYSSRVVTVRHNVRTYSMSADEQRGIIFLTTHHPRWTISRMSLQGMHFTSVVSLVRYGSYPRAIAVHSETRMIYSCNHVKLFSVRYNGRGLTTLSTGKFMNAVTLDINNGLLYYSNRKKLMKRSLSTNTSSEMTEFGFTIWNLIYYRDTVYYISYSSSPDTLGAVDVGYNNVSYTLQTVKVSGVSSFAICLIP